jgi:hypothetical protein
VGLAERLTISQSPHHIFKGEHERGDEIYPLGGTEPKQRRARIAVQRSDLSVGVRVQGDRPANVTKIPLKKCMRHQS